MTGSTPASGEAPSPPESRVTSLLATVARAWARTDRGWRAVLVAGVVAIAVQLGVPIPW